MRPPAQRLSRLRESTIREMTRLALEHGAINLAQGFPDFPPPPEVLQAAHDAIDAGHNQYAVTWGIKPLRDALAAMLRRRYDLDFDPERDVVVTCGVTEAITAALLAAVDPGGEVIIIEPFHENYLPAATFAGADAVFHALRPPYALETEELRRAFTPRTRAILINSPHNPSGRVFTRAELEGVARLCVEHDVVAITDEIYDRILYDGREHVPLATLPGMAERTITIGGLGKTFAVTGWRLGYACAQGALATALRTVHDFLTICAPTPLQHAAAAAMTLPEAYYEALLRDYTERRRRMMAILAEHGFRAREPEGAYYVLTDFGPLAAIGDDHQVARHMAREVGVAVVPGSSFYGTPGLGRDTIRWAFAKRLETLDQVAVRLRERLPRA
jgi:aspartate/methionine/tyrosine aminotransferase